MSISNSERVTVDVPEDAFAGDVPLAAVMRGRYVGSLHRGSFVVADGSGRISLGVGNVEQKVFLRSAAKPFQVMPAIAAGVVQRFDLSPPEIAVLCASHNAEPRHMDTVLSVLEKAGLRELNLQCGIHPPMHEPTAQNLIRHGIAPSPVCNNCSGAHTGMLLACVARGWPLDGYGQPDHPLQIETREILAAFAGISVDEIEEATDNCAVPAFRISLLASARAFARLVAPSGVEGTLSDAANAITDAMTAAPEMVGGEARLDSDLMAAAAGSIVSKGGAEAFQGIGLREFGLGFALKISDGNARAVGPCVMTVLDALGVALPHAADTLEDYRRTEVRNPRGDLVGHLQPVFSIESPA